MKEDGADMDAVDEVDEERDEEGLGTNAEAGGMAAKLTWEVLSSAKKPLVGTL